jgi:hypothetical protein
MKQQAQQNSTQLGQSLQMRQTPVLSPRIMGPNNPRLKAFMARIAAKQAERKEEGKQQGH